MPYFTANAVRTSMEKLHATADHMLKIWFTLKQMGMAPGVPVEITTSSPTPALQRLFSYGHPDGDFFIPFAHTKRFLTMDAEAGRSIIQTNIRRWLTSGSVVGNDPTTYLGFQELPSGALQAKPKRNYPMGLGFGRDGFALKENSRVSIPDLAFAVWYYRQTAMEIEDMTREQLRHRLAADLSLSAAEMDLIFVQDGGWAPAPQDTPLTDNELYTLVTQRLNAALPNRQVIEQTYEQHATKVRSMVTISQRPEWLNIDPRARLDMLVKAGAKAILLFGPPRTSKTHAIDDLIARNAPERETIQIHGGWGYDDLIIGLRPEGEKWDWKQGPLLQAIRGNKKCIVLEEINRTEFSQAIGEVFSLLEDAYRGDEHQIRLRNGDNFFIPKDVLVVCTMNTLDRSTEDIDDALFGRMAAIEFPPRVEDLHTILEGNGVSSETSEKVRDLFVTIQRYYPLGHAYFAGFQNNTAPIEFYVTRIRPVLQKHLQNYRDDDLQVIDEKVNQLFNI